MFHLIFLSTLSLRRATAKRSAAERRKLAISIHALLAESDDIKPTSVLTLVQFLSTLSLRRATISGGSNFPANKKFLSTLSLRRATISAIAYPPKNSNFYPRSPCGERHLEVDRLQIIFDISIHALLAESDRVSLFAPGARDQFLSTLSLRRATYSSNGEPSPFAFLSTLSLRRATVLIPRYRNSIHISIHALLAESDSVALPGR